MDTQVSRFFFAYLWTVATNVLSVILICLCFLRNIPTMPSCSEITFLTTFLTKFGKFQNPKSIFFCGFFMNQNQFKCRKSTQLGLLCLRPSLNGWNVIHIIGDSIIVAYNKLNIANVTLALYHVWCHIPQRYHNVGIISISCIFCSNSAIFDLLLADNSTYQGEKVEIDSVILMTTCELYCQTHVEKVPTSKHVHCKSRQLKTFQRLYYNNQSILTIKDYNFIWTSWRLKAHTQAKIIKKIDNDDNILAS